MFNKYFIELKTLLFIFESKFHNFLDYFNFKQKKRFSKYFSRCSKDRYFQK